MVGSRAACENLESCSERAQESFARKDDEDLIGKCCWAGADPIQDRPPDSAAKAPAFLGMARTEAKKANIVHHRFYFRLRDINKTLWSGAAGAEDGRAVMRTGSSAPRHNITADWRAAPNG